MAQFRPILAEEKTEMRKIMEAIEAYKIIQLKNKKSPKDFRILSSLDEDMQDLFSIMMDDCLPLKQKNLSIERVNNSLDLEQAKEQDKESYQDACENEF